jgi:RNA recognition motif-containing protein
MGNLVGSTTEEEVKDAFKDYEPIFVKLAREHMPGIAYGTGTSSAPIK